VYDPFANTHYLLPMIGTSYNQHYGRHAQVIADLFTARRFDAERW
jgi:hypothetical protein